MIPSFLECRRMQMTEDFMAMPAYLGGSHQMAGMKWYGSNVENKKVGLPRSILMMMLNDKDTGAPLALMSANLVSAYRTGGIPGVGAKYLARKRLRVVSIIGPVLWEKHFGSFRQCLPEPGYGENKGKKPAVSGCFYPVYQGGTASDQKY